MTSERSLIDLVTEFAEELPSAVERASQFSALIDYFVLETENAAHRLQLVTRIIAEARTSDIVDELSKRDGVKRIDVAPHLQAVEIVVIENGEVLMDEVSDGPQIILRVWD